MLPLRFVYICTYDMINQTRTYFELSYNLNNIPGEAQSRPTRANPWRPPFIESELARLGVPTTTVFTLPLLQLTEIGWVESKFLSFHT